MMTMCVNGQEDYKCTTPSNSIFYWFGDRETGWGEMPVEKKFHKKLACFKNRAYFCGVLLY